VTFPSDGLKVRGVLARPAGDGKFPGTSEERLFPRSGHRARAREGDREAGTPGPARAVSALPRTTVTTSSSDSGVTCSSPQTSSRSSMRMWGTAAPA